MSVRKRLTPAKAAALFQERFVAEYLVDLNSTQAYLRAKNGTVTEGTAATEGWRLLRMPQVQKAITEGKTRQLAALEMSASNVLVLLWKAATIDPSEMFDDAWKLLPLSKMTPEARRTIEAIEVARANLDRTDGKKDEEFLYKIKTISKAKAIEMLAKHFKLVTEVVEHKDAIDWDKRVARMKAARKRIDVREKR